MTVLSKYVTLSNGKLVSQKANPNGTRTDTWKMAKRFVKPDPLGDDQSHAVIPRSLQFSEDGHQLIVAYFAHGIVYVL